MRRPHCVHHTHTHTHTHRAEVPQTAADGAEKHAGERRRRAAAAAQLLGKKLGMHAYHWPCDYEAGERGATPRRFPSLHISLAFASAMRNEPSPSPLLPAGETKGGHASMGSNTAASSSTLPGSKAFSADSPRTADAARSRTPSGSSMPAGTGSLPSFPSASPLYSTPAAEAAPGSALMDTGRSSAQMTSSATAPPPAKSLRLSLGSNGSVGDGGDGGGGGGGGGGPNDEAYAKLMSSMASMARPGSFEEARGASASSPMGLTRFAGGGSNGTRGVGGGRWDVGAHA